MPVTTLVAPQPDRAHAPRSRLLRACPEARPAPPTDTRAVPAAPPAHAATPASASGAATARVSAPLLALGAMPRRVARLARTAWSRLRAEDHGMSTVEYAIGTLAAAAFAAVLYTVISGDSVVDALTGLVQRALQATF